MAETDCLVAEELDRSQCLSNANGIRRTCAVRIEYRPWEGRADPRRVLDANCNEAGAEAESRSLKTAVVGGPRENVTLSPDDDEVKSAASFAIDRLDAVDDNSKKRILVEILEASSHVTMLFINHL